MIIPAYICDAIRTPFGRCGGALATVRPDDLGAIPLMALMDRNAGVDWDSLDEVLYGCANQAGEDNRNIARMCLLLASLPVRVPGATLNRLCGSGLDAICSAARAIKSGESGLTIAGGVESSSRAPLAVLKADSPFSRRADAADSASGWHFVNRLMLQLYGTESPVQCAENIAREFGIGRYEQDELAFASQAKAVAAQRGGRFDAEITPVAVKQRGRDTGIVVADEHPRQPSAAALAGLPPLAGEAGSVTAGNTCCLHDAACALLLACEKTAAKYSLLPKARVIASACAGVPPRIMGMGPAPAARRALVQARLTMEEMDVIELHESSAAATLAVLRDWGLADDDPRVNANGGAIAIGHAPGASGARLATAAVGQLHRVKGRYALCASCAEVGQGIALILERV